MVNEVLRWFAHVLHNQQTALIGFEQLFSGQYHILLLFLVYRIVLYESGQYPNKNNIFTRCF